ncbi:O-Antigen ligase [Lachnospiraceae bacterium XBB2008]|nr:O-Antigen ligase [Lachnospiraceae bacterium XBB2008]
MNADHEGRSLLTRLFHIWSVISLIAITAALTFYFNQGYYELGEEKFRIFIRVSCVSVPVWAILGLICLIRARLVIDPVSSVKSITATGWFMILLAVSGLISTLTSDYREVSFLGFDGWHMGFAEQMLMMIFAVMAFFLFSRGEKILLYIIGSVILLITAAAFVLGVMNRFSIYPLHMWGQADDFISTLGNINWFCGYWCVWTGIGCGLFLYAQKQYMKILLGIYVWICAVTGVCCGADACYLAWGVISIAGLLWALPSSARMVRLCTMEILMFASLPMIALIGALRPNRMWYDSAWLRGVCYEDKWIMPFIVAMIALSVLKEIFARRDRDRSALRPLICGALIGSAVAMVMIIILNSSIEGGIWPVRGMGIFTWSIGWGSGRGGIWTVCIRLIKSLFPLRIFFGVGCDALCSYAYSNDEIVLMLNRYIGNQYLTNAHNELLSMLINEGILGAFAYFGLQFSHMAGCIKRISEDESDPGQTPEAGGVPVNVTIQGCLLGAAMAAAAYMAVGTVGFMQILSTPFLFMIIGMASGLIKRTNEYKI